MAKWIVVAHGSRRHIRNTKPDRDNKRRDAFAGQDWYLQMHPFQLTDNRSNAERFETQSIARAFAGLVRLLSPWSIDSVSTERA